MNKQELTNKWWYRLLQVIFGILMAFYLIGGVVFFIIGIDEYKSNVTKYQERVELQAQNKELFNRFGKSIPVIDSLIGLDDTQKGEEAAEMTVKNTFGDYFINSKNHNGYHFLRDDEVKLFSQIETNLTKLSFNHAYTEPSKTNTAVFRWIIVAIVYLVAGSLIFWFIRRIFLYIVIKDSFKQI